MPKRVPQLPSLHEPSLRQSGSPSMSSSSSSPSAQGHATPLPPAPLSRRLSEGEAWWSLSMASAPGAQRTGESTYSFLNERSTAAMAVSVYGYLTDPVVPSYYYGMDSAASALRASDVGPGYQSFDDRMFDALTVPYPPMGVPPTPHLRLPAVPHTPSSTTSPPTPTSRRTVQFAHALASPLRPSTHSAPEATPVPVARSPFDLFFPTQSPFSIPSADSSPSSEDDRFPARPLRRTVTPTPSDWATLRACAVAYHGHSPDTSLPSLHEDVASTGTPPAGTDSGRAALSPRTVPSRTEGILEDPHRRSHPAQRPLGAHASRSLFAPPSSPRQVTYPRILKPLLETDATAPTTGYMSRRVRNMPVSRNLPPRLDAVLPQVRFLGPAPREHTPYRAQRATRTSRPRAVPRPFPDGCELEDEAGRVGVFQRRYPVPAPQPNLEGPPLPPRQRTTLRELEAHVGYYAKDIPFVASYKENEV